MSTDAVTSIRNIRRQHQRPDLYNIQRAVSSFSLDAVPLPLTSSLSADDDMRLFCETTSILDPQDVHFSTMSYMGVRAGRLGQARLHSF
ncbi:hypothetical protein VTH06DRAFT_6631 [Thermothelomyces fergusii]